MKSKKITIFNGVGTLGADHTVTVSGPDGTSTTSAATQRDAGRRLGAADDPRLRAGGPIMTSDEVLMLDHVPARVVGRSAAARSGASSPARSPTSAAQVTILEGLPKILPGLDADVANVVVRSFKKKNIDIRTGVKVHRPHAERRGRHRRCTRRRRWRRGRQPRGRRRRRVSVGRRPFADKLGLDGHRRQGRRSRLRRGRRVLPHRRARRVRARRPHQHAATRPRRLRRGDPGDQAHPRREPACRLPTTGCRGRSTAIPKLRSPAPAKRPPARPATTWWWPSTSSGPTAGRRSSASSTASSR